ncbi:MAG: glycosyltransferase [Bacteroidota bacterium]
MKQSLSLVVAVYNAVGYLELILAGLQRQTFRDFELIVADDGSGTAMKELVDRMKKQVSFPIQHLWQEDVGFRKNMMLNKAIGASQAEYLVFIDGDCVPHRKFLDDHWSNHRENIVLCGRRVNLSEHMTDRLTLETIASGAYEKLSVPLLIDGLLGRSSNLEDAIRIENPAIRRMLHQNTVRILGCNFSVEKRLLEEINGFNEDYEAPGRGEDSDIAFRLGLIGAQFITLRYLAVLYHLYHPVTKVGEENKRIHEQVMESRNPICANGLRKLQSASPAPN